MILLNDTSVLLNLLAASCLEPMALATGWQFAVCSSVRDEVKKLRDPTTLEMKDVNVEPYVSSGVLQVLTLSGTEEEESYVEHSMIMDDGEAMSVAIASCRHFDLAIDDRKAIRHVQRTFPTINIWGTPELLKYWTESSAISPAELRDAISMIEIRARYFPAKEHALWSWWARAKA